MKKYKLCLWNMSQLELLGEMLRYEKGGNAPYAKAIFYLMGIIGALIFFGIKLQFRTGDILPLAVSWVAMVGIYMIAKHYCINTLKKNLSALLPEYDSKDMVSYVALEETYKSLLNDPLMQKSEDLLKAKYTTLYKTLTQRLKNVEGDSN